MLDTDQPGQLTATGIRADLLATYADLISHQSQAELESEWPQVAYIDRGTGDPLGLASIIDVEKGTHRPADAPGWYDRQHARGIKYLTVYCNRSTLPAVNAAMGKRKFFRWVATLDGTVHVPSFTPGKTPAAVQCLGAAALGFHADLSLVYEDWWQPTPRTPADTVWVAAALASLTRADSQLGTLHQLLEEHK